MNSTAILLVCGFYLTLPQLIVLSMSSLHLSKRFLNEFVVHNHMSYKIKKMYMRKAKAGMHRLISNSLFAV